MELEYKLNLCSEIQLLSFLNVVGKGPSVYSGLVMNSDWINLR